MSNYKLIQVVKKVSGQEIQGLYDYTDKTALLSAINTDFGTQVKDTQVVSVYCVAIDNETGAKIDSRFYTTPNEIQEGEQTNASTAIRHRVYTHNDYSDDNIAAYESERLALGNYHSKKGAAMAKPECRHAVTILIDEKGDFIEFSNWERPEA